VIGGLRGAVAAKSPGTVLVDVGGVLYEVAVSLQAYARIPAEGARVALDVVTHVREDAIVLFGFLDPVEKTLFNWLRAVSGVGPRLSLNILSGIPAEDLHAALGAGDVARLCRIPGIGKKTAERLVVELRERSQQPLPGAAEPERRDGGGIREEALSALVNLGYRRAEAERVLAEVGADVPLEEAIREALRRFAR
jgi:Holliday junction DNA helicase RuvA